MMAEQSRAVPLLSIRDLRVGSGDEGSAPIIDGISLDVLPHEAHALVGESGSGKSLTLRAIMGLLPENLQVLGGSIRFEGEELLGLSENRLRAIRGTGIAMVFQEPAVALNQVITVGRQITDAYRERQHLSRHQASQKAIELLAAVGIPEPEKKVHLYPFQFSGGMRQRVMIAASVACQPRLILCDEPTTALDVTVQAQVLALFARMRDELDASMLYVTHDLAVARELCTEVSVMQRGEICEQGSLDDVFNHPQSGYTRRLLAAMPCIDTPKTDIDVSNAPAPVLEVSEVSLSYGGSRRRRQAVATKALDGVSLQVRPGEISALVGESGSGKSTLAKAVMGLEDATEGRILLDGVELRPQRDLAQRAAIQMVFQDPFASLDPRYTIRRTLTEVLELHTDLDEPGREARCREILRQVQLPEDLLDATSNRLSGGQRQRVAIARALCTNPRVLVADEATSALDVSVQAEILQLFRTLSDEQGIGILFIAHDLAVVKSLSDWTYVIYHGEIVEHGLTGALFADPQAEYTRRLLAAVPGRAA